MGEEPGHGGTEDDRPLVLDELGATGDVDRDIVVELAGHKGSGLPTFLVGGAAASSIGSGLRGAVSVAGGSAAAGVIATVAVFALLLTIVAGLVVPLGVVYVTTRL